MATAQKPDRRSLSGRDRSLAARAGARVSAALGAATAGGVSGRFETPSKELVNKVLLALGIRALVTGIALTLISPTVPVFVGVNLLFGVPVAARYLLRRRTGGRGRRRGLGGGRSPSLSDRLARAVQTLADLTPSDDSNRL